MAKVAAKSRNDELFNLNATYVCHMEVIQYLKNNFEWNNIIFDVLLVPIVLLGCEEALWQK